MAESNQKKSSKQQTSSMQFLHAYWRMPYIRTSEKARKDKNPFVYIHKSGDDKKEFILYRGHWNYIVMNRFPYNAGHLLVLPYREVPTLEALTLKERHELMDLIITAQGILTRGLSPDGFNVGFNFGDAAGAGIPCHLHCHIVPRWNGDTNFMPVIGNTRVLPDSMEAM